jgi:hypothetical protein
MWNRRLGMPLKQWGMLVLDAFKGHLTSGIKATITYSFNNKDLVLIPGGITSKLQFVDSSEQTIQRPPKKSYKVSDS